MRNIIRDQNGLEPVTPATRLRRAAPQLANLLSACCEYVDKFGELSEAPTDSDCWKVLEASRNLLAEIAGQPLPYPKRAA